MKVAIVSGLRRVQFLTMRRCCAATYDADAFQANDEQQKLGE